MKTRPAVIPAAGRGTRLRPITCYVSKLMLPLGSEPVIRYALREADESGCDPVVVVVSPEHSDLISYLKKKSGNLDAELKLAEQKDPLGLGDALLRGYNLLEEDSQVAALIPDNVILNGSGIGSLLHEVPDSKQLAMGITSVTRQEAQYFSNSGQCRIEREIGESYPILDELEPKGSGTFEETVDDWPADRSIPRYLLGPRFFEITRDMEPDPETGEIDEVPVVRELLDEITVPAIPVDGDVFDMGQPDRYLRLCSRVFQERTED